MLPEPTGQVGISLHYNGKIMADIFPKMLLSVSEELSVARFLKTESSLVRQIEQMTRNQSVFSQIAGWNDALSKMVKAHDASALVTRQIAFLHGDHLQSHLQAASTL